LPLNVWEYDQNGSLLERSEVVQRVEEWLNRVNALYQQIEEWVRSIGGLRAERYRSVTMSEEPMERFAVPDREVPVLDISRDAVPILSFVPYGLWIVGADGRIDVITRGGTHFIVDQGLKGTPYWLLVHGQNRKCIVPFDQEAFVRLAINNE
jgi:hypothetical protein